MLLTSFSTLIFILFQYFQYFGFLFFQIDGMSKEDMGKTIVKYNMKSPLTNNDLSEPMEFNLMFSTAIGPTGHIKG